METSHSGIESAKLVCIWARLRHDWSTLSCVLVHLLCQASIWSTRNFSYLSQHTIPKDLLFSGCHWGRSYTAVSCKERPHKLPVPSPLTYCRPWQSVARVMFESKRDPDGLATWTTQSTSSKSQRHSVYSCTKYQACRLMHWACLLAGLFWEVFPISRWVRSLLSSLYWKYSSGVHTRRYLNYLHFHKGFLE